MKKKVWAAAGISGLLMVGGVLSASASTSGYDQFKTAAKNMQNLSSFTAHVQGSLTDNGKVVYQVDTLSTQNLKDESGNSTVSVTNSGKTTKVDYYSNNDQTVVKSSDDANYYVKAEADQKDEKEHKEKKDNEKFSPQMQKDMENIFDAVTKNYQDKISTKAVGNGKTELTLDLSKNQIPTVAQAVVSFFLKNIDQQKHHEEKAEFGSLKLDDLKPVLPQLKNNISVSRVVLKGEVGKDQYLEGQAAEIYVSGDDVNGTHHDLVLKVTNQFDNINKASVQSVDLTGKTIVKVQEKHERHHED